MSKGAVKGKALVGSLRRNPKVRNADALAAWIGRHHHKLKGTNKSEAGKKVAGAKSSGVKNKGAKAPSIQGRKLSKSELAASKKRSDDAVRARFGATAEDLRNELIEAKAARKKGIELATPLNDRHEFAQLPKKKSYKKGEEVVGFPKLDAPWGGQGNDSPDMRRGKVVDAKPGKVAVIFDNVRGPRVMSPDDLRVPPVKAKGKATSKAAGVAPDSFRERAATSGSMAKKAPKPSGNEDPPRPSEVKRVHPGIPGSTRMADGMPLAAGMKVQDGKGRLSENGVVAGVLPDGRIKVRIEGGDHYTTKRENLLIDIHDSKTRDIGNKLAKKASLDRLKKKK